jgi:PAS domain S-box-containing protein
LSEAQEYYRTILDSGPDGVFVTDAEGIVRFWNRGMEEMFGPSGVDIAGSCLFDASEYWQGHTAAFQRVMDSHQRVHMDRLARVNHRGTPVVESISFQPLWRNDALDGVLGRVTDVTEQADLEKQLIKSERLAAVGELAAGVAHNFNNILAGIGGDAQLLRMIAEEDRLGDAVINSAEMIYRETMRGGRIAHDLLSFARGQEPCLSEVDVRVLVMEAVRLAKAHPQASSVELRPQVPSGLPRVSADPNQLHQVFFNIIVNGIQAMPHGGTLTVDALIVSGNDGRPRLEVRFVDTGVGIPEEHLARIFDPFFTNRCGGSIGTGLGLSVSQSMIRGMSGDIRVKSELGRGTAMAVVLPVVERRHRPRCGNKPKLRILIADDEPTIRRTMSTFLSRSGFTVVAARDGAEAVDILLDPEADFCLAVMDLMMPRTPGLEVLGRIHELRPNLPIVVLAGVDGDEGMDQLGALGVLTVLQKPLNFDDLLKSVRAVAGEADTPAMAETATE